MSDYLQSCSRAGSTSSKAQAQFKGMQGPQHTSSVLQPALVAAITRTLTWPGLHADNNPDTGVNTLLLCPGLQAAPHFEGAMPQEPLKAHAISGPFAVS